MQLEILDWVSSNNITLESCKLNNNGFAVEQLALDSRTGEVSSYFSAQGIAHHRDYEVMMQICGLQFQKSPLNRVKPDFIEEYSDEQRKQDSNMNTTGSSNNIFPKLKLNFIF